MAITPSRLALVLAAAALAQASTPSCAAGLQIFVARGSAEPEGQGKMGVVAGNITQRVPGSVAVAIDYPAEFLDYWGSVAEGRTETHNLVTEYVNACPNGRVALLGYSQGAQIMADLVCGTSSIGFNATTDLDPKYQNNIVAIILFGDPTRAANQPWNAGTVRDRNGLFPRRNNTACDPYASGMRSWCDRGDRYCDLGNQTLVHGSYFGNYTDAAVDFVAARFAESRQPPPSGSPTGAPTGPTTPSSPPPTGAAARVGGLPPAAAALFAVTACGLVSLVN